VTRNLFCGFLFVCGSQEDLSYCRSRVRRLISPFLLAVFDFRQLQTAFSSHHIFNILLLNQSQQQENENNRKTRSSVAASVRVGNALGAGNTEQAIMSSKLYVIVGGMCETQLYINWSLIYVSFSSWCLIFAILYCPLLPISTITSHFHHYLPDSYSGMHYCSCTRSLEGRDWIHFHYRPVSKKTSSLC
jgi:hypothetical protein